MHPLNEEALALAPDGEPDWLRQARIEAFNGFIEAEMPSSRAEEWRYVEFDFDVHDLALATEAGSPLGDDDVASSLAPLPRISVIDGRASGSSSDQLVGLAAASIEREDVVRSASTARTDPGTDIFAAAHGAFGGDGALLHLGKGVVAGRPFHVDVQGTFARSVSFPGVWVELEEGSFASLVVHLRAVPGALLVPQFALHLGPGSGLKLTIVQDVDYAATSIAHARVVVERDAAIELFEIGLGGDLARLALTTDLVGDGSSANIIGAYFGEGNQTLDYRYVMHHVGRNTRSDMFLKGAVEDEAVSVFTGLIRIEETGQKTEAFQTNRNLLLSEGATAQSVPNLEILANDVKCGHGSTVGPLDADQRYYLMSRGLEHERADRLLVHGFFEEVLSRLAVDEVVGPIRDRMNRKYVAAQEEGRV